LLQAVADGAAKGLLECGDNSAIKHFLGDVVVRDRKTGAAVLGKAKSPADAS